MPHWATAVLAVETQTSEPVPESLVQPGRGRVLASSRLLDAGDGGGRLWLLERDAWGEASATRPGEGRQLRAFRIREALVAEGAAAPADGWYVSAAADLGRAALQFDDPAVAGAIQRTVAGDLPLLGRRLVATSTLMSDWSRCAGALTVFEARWEDEARTLAWNDPWRAIFPGRVFRLERAIVARLPAPVGPVTLATAVPTPGPPRRSTSGL